MIFKIDKFIDKKNPSYYFDGLCFEGDISLQEALEIAKNPSKIKKFHGIYVFLIKYRGDYFIFNDWLSKKPIYYFNNNKYFVASDSFYELVNYLIQKKQKLSLSKEAFCMSLIRGSISDDYTHFKEIKYLKAFQYIKISKEKDVEILSNEPSFESNNYKDKVKMFDSKFTNALKRQLIYNQSHNYKQIFSISAGMDSRSVLFKATKLGFKPDFAFSYSQKNCIDDIVSRKICKKMSINLITKNLEDGNVLKLIDQGNDLNEGQQLYCGSTGALLFSKDDSFWAGIDKNTVIHSGLLGGELLGDPFYKTIFSFKKGYERYNYLATNINSSDYYKKTLLFETRNCQNLMRQLSNRCFVISPFMDEEFYEYCYFLTEKDVKSRKLYFNWMKKYIPNNYITTYNKSHIQDPGIVVFIRRFIDMIKRRIFGYTKFNMNPINKWGENKETKLFLNNFFIELCSDLKLKGNLFDMNLIEYFNTSDFMGKLKCINYLVTIKKTIGTLC